MSNGLGLELHFNRVAPYRGGENVLEINGKA